MLIRIKEEDTCLCMEEKREERMIECERPSCTSPWWHTSCVGMSSLTSEEIKKIEFVCPLCMLSDKKFKKHFKVLDNKLLDKVDKVCDELSEARQELKAASSVIKEQFEELKSIRENQNQLQTLQEKEGTYYAKVSQQLDDFKADFKAKHSWADIASKGSESGEIITTFAKKVADTQFQLSHDRQEREKNIMMFNVKESQSEENQQIHDESLFSDLCCQTLGFKKVPEAKIIRIRSKRTEYSNPIKVTFSTSWDKRMFLANLYKLKTSETFSGIRVSHDMNLEDRSRNKELLKEAYELNNNVDKSSNIRFKVRGPPGAQKILKVFQKNSN